MRTTAIMQLAVIVTVAALSLRAAAADELDATRAAPALSESPSVVLRQALNDFDAAVALKNQSGLEAQRLFREALARFEALRLGGVENAYLDYNIGNTYLRLGEVGRAVVNYRRALRLTPGDERIRKNLQAARKLCRVQIPSPATSDLVETLFFWHFDTPLRARTNAALGGWVVFWGLLLIGRAGRHRLPEGLRTTGLVAIVLTGVFLAALGASAAADHWGQQRQIEGVIIADDVVVRKGYSEYYEPQFEQMLSQGVEFRLLESHQDAAGTAWYRIELRDGKTGWLRADLADVI